MNYKMLPLTLVLMLTTSLQATILQLTHLGLRTPMEIKKAIQAKLSEETIEPSVVTGINFRGNPLTSLGDSLKGLPQLQILFFDAAQIKKLVENAEYALEKRVQHPLRFLPETVDFLWVTMPSYAVGEVANLLIQIQNAHEQRPSLWIGLEKDTL